MTGTAPQSHFKSYAFTLIEIMIVVMIIGILLAVAVPNWISAREASRAKACVANLKEIDTATQQWAMDNKVNYDSYTTVGPPSITATSGVTQLVGSSSYIRSTPVCPCAGTYTIAAALNLNPTCSVPAANSTDTNYQSGGKYYHGM